MADKSEGSLDGKPLSSLRVVDLKNALQERGLPKGGSKKELVERLKLVSGRTARPARTDARART